jgi:signal transduction histidine kinase
MTTRDPDGRHENPLHKGDTDIEQDQVDPIPGPGIPEYAEEKLFEKFFSLPRPDTGKKSTGLGLNFVREVAALHGGEIRLENLPGLAFRTTLLLPAAR